MHYDGNRTHVGSLWALVETYFKLHWHAGPLPGAWLHCHATYHCLRSTQSLFHFLCAPIDYPHAAWSGCCGYTQPVTQASSITGVGDASRGTGTPVIGCQPNCSKAWLRVAVHHRGWWDQTTAHTLALAHDKRCAAG